MEGETGPKEEEVGLFGNTAEPGTGKPIGAKGGDKDGHMPESRAGGMFGPTEEWDTDD